MSFEKSSNSGGGLYPPVDEDGNWLPEFSGVFVVLGLLSIAYIVSRKRD
jgi:hypothetical protein